MQAVRLMGHRQVELIDLPDPEPKEGWVVVEVRASAICGSELHGYFGETPLPGNAGHEAAGVVVDATRSRRWREGDRVGLHAIWGCGACRWCLQGIYTFCPERQAGLSNAHAERVCVPEHTCLPLPEDIPFDVGCLLAGDGFGVPYHTGTRLPTHGGMTVVVVGCGPIGLGNIILQAYRGARVIAADLRTERLELARELGAEATVDVSQTRLTEAIAELTHGEMAECAIEASGTPAGFRAAIATLGPRGILACCGENREVTIHVGSDLIRADRTIFGSWFYHYREFPEMVHLYRQGCPIDRLITHRFPLHQAAEAYATFVQEKSGKVILMPSS